MPHHGERSQLQPTGRRWAWGLYSCRDPWGHATCDEEEEGCQVRQTQTNRWVLVSRPCQRRQRAQPAPLILRQLEYTNPQRATRPTTMYLGRIVSYSTSVKHGS